MSTISSTHVDLGLGPVVGGGAVADGRPTVLFAGGGTGGHILPNVAVAERLLEDDGQGDDAGLIRGIGMPRLDGSMCIRAHFLVSEREIDAEIAGRHGLSFTAVGARAWSGRPWRWPGFAAAMWQATRGVERLMRQRHVRAVVATGGFVSGPAVWAAARLGVPVALVNLDAAPGKANRRFAAKAAAVFSVYPTDGLAGPCGGEAEPIGLPLRRAAVGPASAGEAREALGLEPSRQTLLLTGGSQGAGSINDMMAALLERGAMRERLGRAGEPERQRFGEPESQGAGEPESGGSGGAGDAVGFQALGVSGSQALSSPPWQVLHLCGPGREEAVRAIYGRAGVDAVVLGFCDRMGLAWRAATVAISRAGAGSVAEAWANRTPTIFLPYPYHKDEHQRLNAGPLAQRGGAVLLRDLIDAQANAAALEQPLLRLMDSPQARRTMLNAMMDYEPADGAAAVAGWVKRVVG